MSVQRAGAGVKGLWPTVAAYGLRLAFWTIRRVAALPWRTLSVAGTRRARRIRLRVAVMMDERGAPVVERDRARGLVREAQETLGPAGIRLDLEAVAVVPGAGCLDLTACSPGAVREPWFEYFARRAPAGRLTVFLVRSIVGAHGCSFPGTRWAVLARNANGSVLVHELGHLAGLWRHSADPDNVMTSSACGRASSLTRLQRLMFRTAPFTGADPGTRSRPERARGDGAGQSRS